MTEKQKPPNPFYQEKDYDVTSELMDELKGLGFTEGDSPIPDESLDNVRVFSNDTRNTGKSKSRKDKPPMNMLQQKK